MAVAEAGVTKVYAQFGITPAPTFNSTTVLTIVPEFAGTTPENEQFWFHPDHLGSSNYVTNIAGEVSQHTEYFAFGETFIEEHKNSHNSPYKFNGKELDEETGLYYYGARYYDPRISIWLSVDAEYDKYPHYSPYNYCLQNPIVLLDPDGNSPISIFAKMAMKQGIKQGAKNLIKNVVENRLKAYMSKGWAKQLLGDSLDALDMAMGQSWWEYAIEFIPVVGDAYGGYKLTEQGMTIYKLTQRIEKRIDAIADGLKGVAGGKLRNALGLKKGDGMQAHHLIPVELLKKNEVVQDAVSAGFNFNGKKNGLAVLGNHGPHAEYTDSILGKITDWQKNNPDYTPEQAKSFMEKLADQAKQQIQKNSGDVKKTRL